MMKKRFVLFALAVLVVCGPAKIWAKDQGPTVEARPKAIKAVDWKELAKLLPEEIKGMKAEELEGGTFTMGDPSDPVQQFSYSSVEREFTAETKEGEDKEITIRIMDSGLNQMMIAPYTMMMEYDSPDGSMKTTEIKGHKAMVIVEKDKGELEGHQIIVLAGNRIMVMVEGNELTTLDEIARLAEAIDYDELAKLTK